MQHRPESWVLIKTERLKYLLSYRCIVYYCLSEHWSLRLRIFFSCLPDEKNDVFFYPPLNRPTHLNHARYVLAWLRLSCLDDQNERNRKAKQAAENLCTKERRQRKIFLQQPFTMERLRCRHSATGGFFCFVFFFLTRHEVSDKHWGDILTLKMQYPSRRECGETSPAGVFREEEEEQNHKAASAHHNILIKNV